MTNVKYLKENNLYEAHKHFMRMAEGFGYSSMVQEEGDEDEMQQPNNAMGGDPNAMGGAPDMGGNPNAMGGDPNAMGGAPDMGGDPNAMGGAPDMGGDPNAMGGAPDMGGDPNAMGGAPDMGGDTMPPMEDEEPSPEDDPSLVDVEDITKAQEKTKDKVNSVGRDVVKVDKRLDSLMAAIDKMEAMIDANNQHIDDLNREFQKRNPTEVERLNLRSLDSYPFNVRPTDYWRDKGINSNYTAYFNNNEPTTHEYTITNDDVDDMNEREVAGSFYVDDNLKQDLNKIFGF